MVLVAIEAGPVPRYRWYVSARWAWDPARRGYGGEAPIVTSCGDSAPAGLSAAPAPPRGPLRRPRRLASICGARAASRPSAGIRPLIPMLAAQQAIMGTWRPQRQPEREPFRPFRPRLLPRASRR